jgi:hypothetical protein
MHKFEIDKGLFIQDINKQICSFYFRYCLRFFFLVLFGKNTFITVYQLANVYMEETVGRKIEKQHIEHVKDTSRSTKDILELICFNIYRWLGTIIHILVAVTRLDIWLIIAVIDTLARAYMWSNSSTSRRPRIFTM